MGMLRQVTLCHRSLFSDAIMGNARPPRVMKENVQTCTPQFRVDFMFSRRIKVRLVPQRLSVSTRAPRTIRSNHMTFTHTSFPSLSRLPNGTPYRERGTTNVQEHGVTYHRVPNDVTFTHVLRPKSGTFRANFIIHCPTLRYSGMDIPKTFTIQQRCIPLRGFPFQQGRLVATTSLPNCAIVSCLVRRSTFPVHGKQNPRFCFCTYRAFIIIGITKPEWQTDIRFCV